LISEVPGAIDLVYADYSSKIAAFTALGLDLDLRLRGSTPGPLLITSRRSSAMMAFAYQVGPLLSGFRGSLLCSYFGICTLRLHDQCWLIELKPDENVPSIATADPPCRYQVEESGVYKDLLDALETYGTLGAGGPKLAMERNGLWMWSITSDPVRLTMPCIVREDHFEMELSARRYGHESTIWEGPNPAVNQAGKACNFH
jgi:hypothetical protein